MFGFSKIVYLHFVLSSCNGPLYNRPFYSCGLTEGGGGYCHMWVGFVV